MTYDPQDTIVAIASAAGGGARGIVRLAGPRAIELVHPHFLPHAGDINTLRRAAVLAGDWRLPPPEARLPARLYVWPNERSYTRQPAAELHTIGSTPLLQCILEQLCRAGARLAAPGEFTLRAFLAGRLDLTQAEAVLGVIDARDRRQLKVALMQLAGGLSHRLHAARNELLDLLADVEASLDFADEDIEQIDGVETARRLEAISTDLHELLARLSTRLRSDRPPRVVLQGRPNVGKSSLWNALLGRDAAIVSSQPGTTRDYLEAPLCVDGCEYRLIDAAGLDAALIHGADRVSQQMTQQVSDEADLTVLCLDASRTCDAWEWNALWREPEPELVVLNKMDVIDRRWLSTLPPSVTIAECHETIQLHVPPESDGTGIDSRCHRELLPVSALTGQGLDLLRERLHESLQRRWTDDESSLVESTAVRCRNSLRDALQAIDRAHELTADEQGQELIAAELRVALDQLGLIVGAVYTDDLLDRIFERFCIGK